MPTRESPRPRAAAVAVACAVLGLAAAGCGRSTPPAPAPVRGQVLFQGRPLAGGLVVFAPDHDKGGRGRAVAARLDADGRYELAAAPPAAPGAPPGVSQGVPPGWYRISFSDAPSGYVTPFPADLRRPDLSGVTREVLAGRENVLDFSIVAE